jgi:TolB-like protein/Flp pilus assembly protein TadD
MRLTFILVVSFSLGAVPDRLVSAQCPDGSTPPCQTIRPAMPPTVGSVAVLYFDNASHDTAYAYLGDGLTEAIIVRLGKIERLMIQSRSAVRRFRGRDLPNPNALGRTLGVTYLVNGTLRHNGDRLRLTVELVRAANGVQMWGEQYDLVTTDLLTLEESIARAIATAVTGQLLPQERRVLAARATQNPQAYDHFLRGNYYYAKRTNRALTQALAEYDSAARLDSTYASAIARSAATRVQRGGLTDNLWAEVRASAARAVRLDSTSSEAWIALGYTRMETAEYDAARQDAQRAIIFDSKNAEAHHLRAFVLRVLGHDSSAVAAYRRALAIDPERAITLVQLAGIHHVARRYGEARRLLDSALVVDPEYVMAYGFRARIRVRLGDLAGAREDARIAGQLGTSAGGQSAQWLAELAWVLVEAAEGDTAAAHARAQRLVEPAFTWVRAVKRRANPTFGNMAVAMALAAAGEAEPALDLLELFSHDGRLHWGLEFPEFDPLRTHPRFQRLLEESRLPETPP